jgi:adenylate cyclase
MPIGVKLNTIIIFILCVAFGSILYFATTVFKMDNRDNINSLNAKIAMANAEKVNAKLETITNNFLSIGKIISGAGKRSNILDHYFNDKSMLSIKIINAGEKYWAKKGGRKKLKKRREVLKVNKSALAGLEVTKEQIEKNIEKNMKNFKVSFQGEIKLLTVITSNNIPLMFISMPFIQDSKGEFNSIIIGAVDHSTILKMFEGESLFTSYLLDDKGYVMAHPDSKKVIAHEDYSNLPLVKTMLEGKVKTGQQEFLDENHSPQLGAYSLVGVSGVGVVSQVSKARAYEATEKLIEKSVKVSLIVLFASIILVYLYSNSITNPLAVLVEMTERITNGTYNILIPKKANDEIGELAYAFEEMATGLEQRERLKNTFGKFVNKQLAQQALDGELTIGGERKNVTVFFSDIRGFTNMSETMKPEAVLHMLNEYMSAMVEVIVKWGGVVDKFVGDAIMAIWGAPITTTRDAQKAVLACLEMRQVLFDLNEKRTDEGKPAIAIGMGLNTGSAIAGNMGSSEKMEYTVLGDTVNLASRIESQTKELKTDFLINQTTLDACGLKLQTVPCKNIAVKGKEQLVQLHKVIGVFIDGELRDFTGDPYLPPAKN